MERYAQRQPNLHTLHQAATGRLRDAVRAERVIRKMIAQMQSFKITIISREAQHAGVQPQDENICRELRDGCTQCQCSLSDGFQDRSVADAGGIEAAPGFRHFLGSPRCIPTISRLQRRSPGFAGASERSPGADEPPVSPHGCRDLLALAARQRARALGKPFDSLGLHLSAAIHRPRSGALRHTAVDLGKTGRRHGECASRAASAGKPLRQRTGGVAAHLRARCSQ